MQPRTSTRVVNPKQHARTGAPSYPYREKADYVLQELDLKPGDVVVDIGAGDGWWAERMAPRVGPNGTIHALEVDQKKVDRMKAKFADVPQVKPYLSKKDGTGLAENCCDLAFLSQTYHHLDAKGRTDYLRKLRNVVKPTGRLCVIEKYSEIATRGKTHGTQLSKLLQVAEETGWIPVRCELMRGTYHYLAIFVQRDLFTGEPEPAKKPKPAGKGPNGKPPRAKQKPAAVKG